MLIKFKILIVLLILSLSFGGGGFFYNLPIVQAQDASRHDSLLVKFKDSDQVYKINLDSEINASKLIEFYSHNDLVEYIEPNYSFQASAFPSDTHYLKQFYLPAIDAQRAWSKELLIRQQENINSRSIIAILDTGVDLDHPDLKDNIWLNSDEIINGIDDDNNGYIDDLNGWDFINEDNSPNPDFDSGFGSDAVNHGTLIAGVAAAKSNNGQGIAGVSWFSDIMPLRVLNSQGSGDAFDVVRAIDYAVANGADVINMSFVGASFSESLYQAIKRAYDQGVVVVAAAGNTDPLINGVDLDIAPSYPVCYAGPQNENIVIGVASIDSNFRKSAFSNYGNCIDLVAPGELFFSTQVYDKNQLGFDTFYNGFWSGTSLSAPLVSGVIASIKSLRPEFSLSDLQSLLLQNAISVDGLNLNFRNRLGSGKVDFNQTLEAAINKRLSKQEGGTSNYLVVGLGAGSYPHVKVLTDDGLTFKEFFAYSPGFQGTIDVAVGDINDDGKDEIITGAGFGGGPHVRIFNREGILVSHFFAFDKNLRNGVNVAVGDINGDGKDEIITGAGAGSPPEVKVFNADGQPLSQFLAYGQNFKGGVNVAVGDINGDGKDEIVTGAGAGGGPHVRAFRDDGTLLSQFFAYNKDFTGGVDVAIGNLNGHGPAEIITGAASSAISTIRVFDLGGKVQSTFFAYDPAVSNGVSVSSGDFDNDGLDDIIVGLAVGGDGQVRIFDHTGRVKAEILAKDSSYSGGARPAILSP